MVNVNNVHHIPELQQIRHTASQKYVQLVKFCNLMEHAETVAHTWSETQMENRAWNQHVQDNPKSTQMVHVQAVHHTRWLKKTRSLVLNQHVALDNPWTNLANVEIVVILRFQLEILKVVSKRLVLRHKGCYLMEHVQRAVKMRWFRKISKGALRYSVN